MDKEKENDAKGQEDAVDIPEDELEGIYDGITTPSPDKGFTQIPKQRLRLIVATRHRLQLRAVYATRRLSMNKEDQVLHLMAELTEGNKAAIKKFFQGAIFSWCKNCAECYVRSVPK